ncbi:hypothetical protein D3C72_680740 [compost metagenome]
MVALHASACLVVGRQSIADASHQQAHRRLGDDPGVHHHHVRAALVEQHIVEGTVRVVEHRQGAGGGIVGDHRGHDAQRQPALLGNRLGGVEHLATTHPDHPVTAQSLAQRTQPLHLGSGDFAFEYGVMQGMFRFVEADGQGLLQAIQTALAGDDQEALAKPGDMPVKAFKFLVALNVATGRGEYLGHSHLPSRRAGNA